VGGPLFCAIPNIDTAFGVVGGGEIVGLWPLL